MSLKDQMLKAGLVSQKKHKKASKSSKKSRDLAREVKASVESNKQQQVEKARSLNQMNNEQAQQKAIKAQVKQLVSMNKIDINNGDIKYNFTHDNVIKHLYVKEDIRKQLLAGVLAIAETDSQYVVIPASVANKIQQRDQQTVVHMQTDTQESVDEDDPYADFVVPDDLMW